MDACSCRSNYADHDVCCPIYGAREKIDFGRQSTPSGAPWRRLAAKIYFLSGTIYWTTNVVICVIAPATAGVHVFACGINCTIRMVIALAKTPALTFAVGAQLVGVGAGCVPSCESAELGAAMGRSP